ncbi:hypothetical protein, partial [Acinetobacter modestus]|uniref:hypothetical protein n=1 Tax=Acinetobacter modestus TaxID=1776740 RepID=UPI001F4AF70C
LLELEQLIDQHSKAVLVSDYMQMTLEQLQQEHTELLEVYEQLDQYCGYIESQNEKHREKCLAIASLLKNPIDKDMTLKAIKTVIERVGEF